MSERPPSFAGDLEGFLVWAAVNWRSTDEWCARHWAPCPVDGLNGMVATLIMLKGRVFADVPSNCTSAAARDRWKTRRAQELGPMCCRIGDDAVAAIWAEAGTGGARS